MIALLLCLAVLTVAFAIERGLFRIGMRNGDRPGDVVVDGGESDAMRRGISFVVRNPGPQPVLVGASVRRRKLRILGRASQSVSAPRRTLRPELLARQHTVVCVIPAGEAHPVSVPLPQPSSWRAAELVVTIGEPDRLRVVREPVELCPVSRGGRARSRWGLARHSPVRPTSDGL